MSLAHTSLRACRRMAILLAFALQATIVFQPAALQAAEGPKSPVSPEESLRWFQLDDGLRIEIVACEPEVVDPVTVRFDGSGRMWVAEYRDYPNGPAAGAAPLSRIKLLEDKDNDGRYETAHVFAEGLPFCNGLQPWNGGVIATMAGRIAFLKDTDGDNRADVNETWFTGFAIENPQLRVNHPRFGLDNCIYVANGLRGGMAANPRDPKAAPVSLRGHDLKFDPRTGCYEAIAGNGQFGLTFDDYGNRFICSNRNPMMHVVLEDRYLVRNPALVVPVVVNDVAAAGEASHVYPLVQAWTTSILHAGQYSAACGVEVYRGDALPPAYYGNGFTCEPTGSLVHRELVSPAGATFAGKWAQEGREFLASRDPWFRGVYLDGGPDGALYVCDMYRAVIEHPAFMPDELKNRPDLRSGDDRGRIYRIVPKDFKRPEKPPTLDRASAAELVQALEHPNAWWRETAQRLLVERQDEAAVILLKTMIAEGKSAQARVHALWALQGQGALAKETIAVALADKHPRVREQAVLLAESFVAVDADIRSQVAANARHEDGRLRFQTALTLGAVGSPDEATLEALADIIERADDVAWTRLAVGTAAPKDAARLLAIVIGRTKPTDPAEAMKRRSLLRELAVAAGPQIDQTSGKVVRQALTPWETSEEGQELLLAVASGLAKRLAVVFDEAKVDALRKEAFSLVVNSKVEKEQRLDAFTILTAIAAHPSESPAASIADAEAVLKVVSSDPDGEIRAKGLAYLSSRPMPQISTMLIAMLPKQSPAMRGQIFDVLLSRSERVAALLDAMDQGKIKPKDLDQARASRLLKSTDPKIKARAEKLLASSMPADRMKALEDYRQVLALQADARRGKEIFRKTCATCHKIGDVGVDVGPSIADLRTKTLEQVLVDVIQPNKAIDNNFVSYTVVTDDGLQFVGIIAAETPGSVTLKLPDGKQQSVLKSAIDTMESNGVSLMPEGLERNLPHQDMADVISFVKNWRYLDGSVPDAPGSKPAK
ncbi:MAG: c-type cytochrome [Planctomycetia bacterium]|nr:c-type cytochrome [Planctomycetia bacterium]